MLHPELTSRTEELQQVLQLQEKNLLQQVDENEMKSQGFLTLRHDLATLEQMHRLAPSVIIKDGDTVVAYALTMLKECRELMPDLEPMFTLYEKICWKELPLTSYSYYTMGQVCIAKEYRGQGLFDMLYNHHKKIYQPQFDLFVTEIATRNPRSLRAHKRVGFRPIHTHRDKLDNWVIVGWDWK